MAAASPAFSARFVALPSPSTHALPGPSARAPDLPWLAGIELPRGAVIELAAPTGLGRATRLALHACASAQRVSRAVSQDGEPRWCGFVDPTGSLYAPAVVESGVDLERLLVVRPDAEEIAKIAVRMATSRLFAVLVIDRVGVPGAAATRTRTRWDVAVRKLALACEPTDTTVLVLSDIERAREDALPVAMRIELLRPAPDRLSMRVVKDRRGGASGARLVTLLRASELDAHGTNRSAPNRAPTMSGPDVARARLLG